MFNYAHSIIFIGWKYRESKKNKIDDHQEQRYDNPSFEALRYFQPFGKTRYPSTIKVIRKDNNTMPTNASSNYVQSVIASLGYAASRCKGNSRRNQKASYGNTSASGPDFVSPFVYLFKRR